MHIFNICKRRRLYFGSNESIAIFASMEKQERTVVHLELDGNHYYYGNLKALCDNWSKEVIGVNYGILRNYNITSYKPFRNEKCIIRRGVLITSVRNVKKE